MYKEEIIQLSGGLNDYIGKLDQSEHPMGVNWYRILEPCIIMTRQDPKTQQIQNIVLRMKGQPGEDLFRNYVDIRIPDTMPMEIKTIDKAGKLYEVYQKEMNRKKSAIILPDRGIVQTH